MKIWIARLSVLVFVSLSLIGPANGQEAAAVPNPLLAKAASLSPQSGEGEDIKSEFNRNVDNVRLMVLLSPT